MTVKQCLGAGGRLAPSVFVLLLPKCPLCVGAWAAAMGAVGLRLPVYERWVWPASMLLVGLSIFLLWRHSPVLWKPRVLVAGVVALNLILYGKLFLGSPAMAFAGVAVLLGMAALPLFYRQASPR